MSPEKSRNYCWSCGGSDGYHYPGCDNAINIKVKSPQNPPPHCGGKMLGAVLDYSHSEASKEPKLHYCCKCNKPFMATFMEWLEGPCPHCGAKGP